MKFIKEIKEGVLIMIYVQLKVKKNVIEGVDGWCGRLKVRIVVLLVEGKVNKEVVKFFLKFFGVEVNIVRGEMSREKDLLVKGLSVEEVRKKLGVQFFLIFSFFLRWRYFFFDSGKFFDDLRRELMSLICFLKILFGFCLSLKIQRWMNLSFFFRLCFEGNVDVYFFGVFDIDMLLLFYVGFGGIYLFFIFFVGQFC